MTACMGDSSHQSSLDQCPAFVKLKNITQDENLREYITALHLSMIEINSPDISLPDQCSSDEAYAILCDPTERSQIESCERKKLTYVADHQNDNEYHTFVQKNKKNLHLMITRIGQAFPMVNKIETIIAPSDSVQRTMCTYFLVFNLLLAVFL
jgi:hypothetical protein